MTDERARKIDQAKDLLAADEHDDPPTSDVIDAALTHLIESHRNIKDARQQHPPHIVKDVANTSVLGLSYRTSVDSKWR